MTTYDVHAHCVPEGLLEALRRDPSGYGTEVVDTDDGPTVRFAGSEPTRPIARGLLDVDRRLAAMDEARVDVQFLASWIDLTGYGLPADVAVRYTRLFNEQLAATVASHPDRFVGLCNVPLQAPERAAEELRRAVVEDGFVGAEIAGKVADVDLDDRALDPFWEAAEDLRCPILLHPGFEPMGRGLTRYLMDNTVGRGVETTIAVGQLIFGGVLDRHPDLRLLLVHGGGSVPWMTGRWDHAYAAAPGATARHLARTPRQALRNVYFDTVLFDPAVVGYLVDWAGPDRVLLGSDYPFPMGDRHPVDTLERVPGVTDEARRAILGGNVDELLAGIRR